MGMSWLWPASPFGSSGRGASTHPESAVEATNRTNQASQVFMPTTPTRLAARGRYNGFLPPRAAVRGAGQSQEKPCPALYAAPKRARLSSKRLDGANLNASLEETVP